MDNLDNMVSRWHALKKIEKLYCDLRMKVEQEIEVFLHNHHRWKSTGTISLDNLKIRLSLRRKWDPIKLTEIKEKYQLADNHFPFLTEYKEIKNQSDYLAEREPYIWAKLVPALSIYPSKPYFFTPKKGE